MLFQEFLRRLVQSFIEICDGKVLESEMLYRVINEVDPEEVFNPALGVIALYPLVFAFKVLVRLNGEIDNPEAYAKVLKHLGMTAEPMPIPYGTGMSVPTRGQFLTAMPLNYITSYTSALKTFSIVATQKGQPLDVIIAMVTSGMSTDEIDPQYVHPLSLIINATERN